MGTSYKLQKLGPNYRLPSNMTVAKFAFKLAYRKIDRLLYGVFSEKRWNIVRYSFDQIEDLFKLSVARGTVPVLGAGYAFYADPFFDATGDKIRVEALNATNGLGEIVELSSSSFDAVRTLVKGHHYSYPCSFEDTNREYIIPEVASHSSPFLLGKPFDGSVKERLSGLEEVRIVDGTLFKNDGVYYLFGGLADSAADCLYLYFSDDLKGPYKPHPHNPIVIDPHSARMAGHILRCGGRLYRFGQNNSYSYGDGITINEIVQLSKVHYCEKSVGSIAFDDARGPHTIDVFRKLAVLDFYTDRLSFFAGYRRIAARYFRVRTRKKVGAGEEL